jgi:hypothetical protein
MRFAGLLDALVAPLAFIDRLLNAAMPSWLALIAWGVLVGVVSTAIYSMVAPEARIAQVRADAAIARRALNDLADDAEFSSALALAWKSIRLSLNELRLVAGPATAACAPGILLVAYLDSAPMYAPSYVAAHSWLSGWEILFFAAALSSGLTLRRFLASWWVRQ